MYIIFCLWTEGYQ